MSFGNISGLGLPDENSSSQQANFGINLYVDGALGSNSNPGTYDRPFRDIQFAIDMADDSVTPGHNNIFIFQGVYDENLYVNDSDSLTLSGLTGDPYKVIINGQGNDALSIKDGPKVELFNLRFMNGFDGIRAIGVDNLKLFNVVSDKNSDDGLEAIDTSFIHVGKSKFIGNYDDGAFLTNNQTTYIADSWFSGNGDNGIQLDNNGLVGLLSVYSNNNGFMNESNFATFGNGGSGVSAYDTETLIIRDGGYSNNDYNGIFLVDTQNADIQTDVVRENGFDGLGSYAAQDMFVAGGHYEQNGHDGIYFDDDYYEERFVAFAFEENGESQRAEVHGAVLRDNGDDGIEVDDISYLLMAGLDVRRNNDDGVNIDYVERADFYSSFLDDNGHDGAEFDDVEYVTVAAVTAINNGDDGLDVDQAMTTTVHGGIFSNNDEQGIDVDGFSQYETSAHIFGSTANDNGDHGVRLEYLNYGEVKWGGYRNNGRSGIEFNNVEDALAWYTFAERNDDQGLYFGGESESSFSHIRVVGGGFNHNGSDGVQIAALNDYYGEYNGEGEFFTSVDAQVHYVVARENYGHGLSVGSVINGFEQYTAQGYYGEISLSFDVEVLGGYFGFNEYDGISLNASADFGYYYNTSSTLDVYVADAVSEFNGGHGLLIRNESFGFEGPGEPQEPAYEGPNGGGGGSTSATIDRGFYGFNGNEGIHIDAVNVQSDPYGEYSSSESPIRLNYVVSKFNESHGLKIESGEIFSEIPGPPAAYMSEEESAPLVSIIGGNYSFNKHDGVNIRVGNEFENGGAYGYGSSQDSLYLQDVIAEFNEWSGLVISGEVPVLSGTAYNGGSFFGPDVHILRGSYTLNKRDGINLSFLGDVVLQYVVGIANGDDGLDSFNSASVDLGSSVFVANGDEDVVIV